MMIKELYEKYELGTTKEQKEMIDGVLDVMGNYIKGFLWDFYSGSEGLNKFLSDPKRANIVESRKELLLHIEEYKDLIKVMKDESILEHKFLPPYDVFTEVIDLLLIGLDCAIIIKQLNDLEEKGFTEKWQAKS